MVSHKNPAGIVRSLKQIGEVEVFTVMMSPTTANELLDFNTHNRKISEVVVRKYVKEIESGEWTLIPQGIGFDIDNVLLDGQQRLKAISIAGKYVPMIVICGLARNAQKYIDRQRRRSLYDILKLEGLVITRKQTEVATYLARITLDSWDSSLADCEVRESWYAYGKQITFVVEHSKAENKKGIGRVGYLSACVLFYEKNNQMAEKFISKVMSGAMMMPNDSPMRLRKYLLGEAGYTKTRTSMGGATQQSEDFRKTIFAINAFMEGKQILALKEAKQFNF